MTYVLSIVTVPLVPDSWLSVIVFLFGLILSAVLLWAYEVVLLTTRIQSRRVLIANKSLLAVVALAIDGAWLVLCWKVLVLAGF